MQKAEKKISEYMEAEHDEVQIDKKHQGEERRTSDKENKNEEGKIGTHLIKFWARWLKRSILPTKHFLYDIYNTIKLHCCLQLIIEPENVQYDSICSILDLEGGGE